jgi:hypothetical protein
MMMICRSAVRSSVLGARADAERLDQVGERLVLRQLVARRRGDVEDLAAQRQDGLAGAVARLLGRAARRIALDDKQFRALREEVLVQSASLPGSRSLRVAALRATSFSIRRRARSSARSKAKSSSLAAWLGVAASQWSKASRTAESTMRAASAVCSRPLFWPWNSGSRMNTEIIAAQPFITSSAVSAAARFDGRCARRGP